MEANGQYLLSREPLSFDAIHKRCGDLDPTVFVARTGEWCNAYSRKIRTLLNTYFSEKVGFFSSGRHDTQNLYDAWSEYCALKGFSVWADALILTSLGTDAMLSNNDDCKEIAGNSGKDTGLPGEDCDKVGENTETREKNRKRQRAFRKRKQEALGSSLGSDSEDTMETFEYKYEKLNEKMLEQTRKDNLESHRIEAAKALQSNSDEAIAKRATNYLIKQLEGAW